MKARAQLDQRRDPALHRDAAGGRPGDAGDALQHRALARAVAADDAVGAARGDLERHAAQRRERLLRLQIADQAAGEQRALDRREPLAVREAAVDLRHIAGVDGDGAHAHASRVSITIATPRCRDAAKCHGTMNQPPSTGLGGPSWPSRLRGFATSRLYGALTLPPRTNRAADRTARSRRGTRTRSRRAAPAATSNGRTARCRRGLPGTTRRDARTDSG